MWVDVGGGDRVDSGVLVGMTWLCAERWGGGGGRRGEGSRVFVKVGGLAMESICDLESAKKWSWC